MGGGQDQKGGVLRETNLELPGRWQKGKQPPVNFSDSESTLENNNLGKQGGGWQVPGPRNGKLEKVKRWTSAQNKGQSVPSPRLPPTG